MQEKTINQENRENFKQFIEQKKTIMRMIPGVKKSKAWQDLISPQEYRTGEIINSPVY
jgi:hypothetical protein